MKTNHLGIFTIFLHLLYSIHLLSDSTCMAYKPSSYHTEALQHTFNLFPLPQISLIYPPLSCWKDLSKMWSHSCYVISWSKSLLWFSIVSGMVSRSVWQTFFPCYAAHRDFGPMVLTTERGTVHARLLHPSMPVPMLFYQEDKKEQKISTFDYLSSHLLAGVKGVEPLVNIYFQLRRFSFWLSWTQVITVTYTGLHFICKLIRITFISALKPNN